MNAFVCRPRHGHQIEHSTRLFLFPEKERLSTLSIVVSTGTEFLQRSAHEQHSSNPHLVAPSLMHTIRPRARSANLVAASHCTQTAITRLSVSVRSNSTAVAVASDVITSAAAAAFAATTTVEESLASFFVGSSFSCAPR